MLLSVSDTLQLARVPLRGVRSKDGFIGRVKEAVRGNVLVLFCSNSFLLTQTAAVMEKQVRLRMLKFSYEFVSFSVAIIK